MLYRRFGRTELQMPVITCGGMRFQQGFQADLDIDPEGQVNLEATVRRALELGVNHIETARGYGTSELQLGRVLPSIPRDEFILQTKVGPKCNAEEFLADFEKSMFLLGVDHVDLLGLHGLNDDNAWEKAFDHGSLDAALELKKQGRVRHVGFSTHGDTDIIVRACETGLFDYVNLHWFYIDQHKWPAVEAATRNDMGVFIISPNDKGGKLYEPSEKLVGLCAPLSPMAFNDCYTLGAKQVHTLSTGVARPTDFDAHIDALEHLGSDVIDIIRQRLDAEMIKTHGQDWVDGYREGLPHWRDTPGEINLSLIFWLWTLAKAFDLIEYGKMRYNLLGGGGSWFPGLKATPLIEGEVTEAEILAAVGDYPFADRVITILREADELLGAEAVKRLSES